MPADSLGDSQAHLPPKTFLVRVLRQDAPRLASSIKQLHVLLIVGIRCTRRADDVQRAIRIAGRKPARVHQQSHRACRKAKMNLQVSFLPHRVNEGWRFSHQPQDHIDLLKQAQWQWL